MDRLRNELGSLQAGSKHTIRSPAAKGREEKPARILSIDMGYRNLAYCLLELHSSAKTIQVLPTIRAWQRLSMSDIRSAPAPELLADVPPAGLDTSETLASKVVTKEIFDPPTLSAIAHTLLRKHLLTLSPTIILIERQRFRSMGGASVLEWTIRVNMLENILHAVLYTLKAEGLWDGEVRCILPGRVGPFWVGEMDAENNKLALNEREALSEEDFMGGGRKMTKPSRAKAAKAHNKGLKMDLVRSWLEAGDVLTLGTEAVQSMADAYKEKWDRGPGGRKKISTEPSKEVKKEEISKLDDLADCLLQGMAWMKWEENKKALLREGVGALVNGVEEQEEKQKTNIKKVRKPVSKRVSEKGEKSVSKRVPVGKTKKSVLKDMEVRKIKKMKS